MFKKILPIAIALSLVTMALLWMIGHDSICGFTTNCNRGINPITIYGFSLFPLRVNTLYEGGTVYLENILITLVLLLVFYNFITFLFFRFKK